MRYSTSFFVRVKRGEEGRGKKKKTEGKAQVAKFSLLLRRLPAFSYHFAVLPAFQTEGGENEIRSGSCANVFIRYLHHIQLRAVVRYDLA